MDYYCLGQQQKMEDTEPPICSRLIENILMLQYFSCGQIGR